MNTATGPAAPPLPPGSLAGASIDDIRHLVVFAKVAEAGSFARAARALGLATATTSQHVSRLDARLGSALLYRNTRRLSLTQDGERLLETARAMLDLYEQGLHAFQQGGSRRRQLRIAMPSILHRSPLMRVLGDVMRAHPEVDFQLHSSENRHDLVGEGIDVALRAGTLADSGLRARPVFDLRREVVAAPALLEGRARPQHPGELAAWPWIGLRMRRNERTFHRGGETVTFRYDPAIVVDSVEAGYELARQGLGLAAPPDFLLDADPHAGGLVRLLPEWRLEPLTVHALWPANLSRHSLAHALIRTLCERLGTAPEG